MAKRVFLLESIHFFPCKNCGEIYLEHADEKCLYETGRWAPTELENASQSQRLEAIENHRQYTERLTRELEALQAEIARLQVVFYTLTQGCSHVDAAGLSAIRDSGFYGAACGICNANDY